MIGRAKKKYPYVHEDELEIYCWLYVFDDMWDLDEEFFYCEFCGGWASNCEC